MILMNFFDNPIIIIPWLAAIIIALTVHEFSHALAATLLGDSTAKDEGRLTLNPLAHVSWIGFFMLLLVGFGWGKPVPFNPYNLKYQRFGPALVAVAGPFSNLILAIISGVALKLVVISGFVSVNNLLFQFLFTLISLNIVLLLFNLLPFPPLDGSKILFAFLSGPKYYAFRQLLETQGPFFLMLLLIFDNFLNINIFGSIFSVVINFVYSILL
ncbi:MAG: hypothetical protein UT32_C0001G0038 [Parcubacteria group bacterium GW2011_GWC2_39_14]|nr:MAG: hypothetical protein UT32_C0001G0038 [Parcubacteria group bacterium GW2011_GWC2_39_14]KKR55462.1 MAG: hypothetical protein UT91_C0001G0037 [Parcubacteria group bacterium GW2011_GWA2_40_23]